MIVLDNRQSKHLAKMFHSVGYRYPAYRGSASGKVLLAWLTENELLALLPPAGRWPAPTDQGIRDWDGLSAALARVRVVVAGQHPVVGRAMRADRALLVAVHGSGCTLLESRPWEEVVHRESPGELHVSEVRR